ncbi:MAG: type II toxin-antitoxin system RelE/ParE family toxin [Planctomycetales bacterium]|nr:type II toxin-antitoxin system RelE/ParE family toxin [Planctomycetales bacterium]
MASVYKTPQAEQDLISIHNYIAEERQDRINADRYLKRIEDTLEFLATQPRMGRPRDDLEPGVRFHPFERYLNLFRPVLDGIEVLRILHSSRDIETVMH